MDLWFYIKWEKFLIENITLKPVEVIALALPIDNSIDTLLPNKGVAYRPQLTLTYFDRD